MNNFQKMGDLHPGQICAGGEKNKDACQVSPELGPSNKIFIIPSEKSFSPLSQARTNCHPPGRLRGSPDIQDTPETRPGGGHQPWAGVRGGGNVGSVQQDVPLHTVDTQ